MSNDKDSIPSPSTMDTIPLSVHRWNYWISSFECALYIMATNMIGPMTLIPFLFKQTGIDSSYLGLFTISTLIVALSGPIGATLMSGQRRMLPFCVTVGIFQRLVFLMVPLGVMFFHGKPAPLLWILATVWLASNFIGGIATPTFMVMITNGTRERWWGRLMGMRSLLGAASGLVATILVWGVNRISSYPNNYTILGWIGVLLLFGSLYGVSRFREVMTPTTREAPNTGFAKEWVRTLQIWREDTRVRWIVLGRTFRSFGFFTGTYITAMFIARCDLTDSLMWLPVILFSVSDMVTNYVSGRIIDHFGSKPALVLSSLLVAFSAAFLTQCYSVPFFVICIPILSLGGSLINNGWPTFLLKMSPPGDRTAYFSTVSLLSAPPSIFISVAGVFLVQWLDYNPTMWISAVGGLIGALVFQFKLPNIRQAPSR
ncbi:MAG: MFS transporter [Candidatus Hydrogenedentes bacterium]|nr:MFS transporter [Candidatus Hydrogenedentota bacterium]